MSAKKFKIYSSSAGSGKTYTLTKEYLKLALQGEHPHYFKNILAITFTNDAANEMKSRILEALRGFAYPELLSEKEKSKSQALLDSISTELGEEQKTLSQRAQAVFSKIIHNYADFAVSTIDSFVNKVINAFTRELEIPYNYEVDLDTDQLLQNAVDRVIDKVGQEKKERLSDFLVDWVSQKAEEGKNWGRVANDLVEFSKDLINESSYPFIDPLHALSMEDFQQLHEQLKNFQEEREKQLLDLGKKGHDLICQRGLEGSFLGGKRASVASYFRTHAEKRDIHFRAHEKAYMNKALQDDRWYKEKHNAAIEEIKPELISYIEQIEQLKEEQGGWMELVSAILPHLYKLALIQEIEQELAHVKRENNAIHISDSNKKIAEIISTEPVPYIYERVGEKYNHILIDEFQDTSILQWENLLPLIENSLSEASFNLIVGDAKQAIYRWRGGEMEQLVYLYQNRLEELLKISGTSSPFLTERYGLIQQNHQPAQLNANFRSTQEIIQFNNHFFKVLVDTDFGVKYPLFPMIYDQSAQQQIPEQNQKTGGHVEINFIEKSDLYADQTHHRVLDLIEQVLQEGFARTDIAIITRSNAHGKEIAQFLKAHQIEVISQTSLLLASDDKVRFLLALLKVIHRPEDKLAKSEALYLFYKVVKRQIPDSDTNLEIQEIVNASILAFYQKISEKGYHLNFTRLQALTLYELVEKLIGIFDLLREQSRLEYLFRFLDVILQFNLQKNATLGDFLEYWEEKKNNLSINTPKDLKAVTVTTIHKSKGLEYPVVILPFADWNFTPRFGQTMWLKLPADFPALHIQEKNRKLQTALVTINQKLERTPVVEQYRSEMQKTFIENVNMLYVAFTRAVDRLYMLAKHQDFSKKGAQKGVNYLIYLYLLEQELWQEEQRDYVISQGQARTPVPETNEDTPEAFYIEEFVSTDIHKKIRPKRAKKS